MNTNDRGCQVQHCNQAGEPRIGTTINGGLFVLVDLCWQHLYVWLEPEHKVGA